MKKGKEAIRAFCIQQKYAEHVINGGLDYLIARWEGIATHIEKGYGWTFDEYLNDMDSRNIIFRVWSLASMEQTKLYSMRLSLADTKVIRNTVPVELCIWGQRIEERHGYQRDIDWWYYREPKRTSGRWGGNQVAL